MTNTPTNILELQMFWEKQRQQEKWAREKLTARNQCNSKATRGYFTPKRAVKLQIMQEKLHAMNTHIISRQTLINLYKELFNINDRNAIATFWQDVHKNRIFTNVEEQTFNVSRFLALDVFDNIEQQINRIIDMETT